MIDKAAYTLRIAQANPTQLVVINFELICDFLTEALAAYGTESILTNEESKDNFRLYIDKAKDGLQQLIKGLNLDLSIAHDFYEIYRYVHKLLINAYFSLDKNAVLEALELMDTLLVGWREAATQVIDEPPIAGEGPIVYAGLTYSRDGLNEYIMEGEGRSYQA